MKSKKYYLNERNIDVNEGLGKQSLQGSIATKSYALPSRHLNGYLRIAKSSEIMVQYMENEIKPYTKKELAVIYGITSRSFSTWLKPFSKLIGSKIVKYYNIQ